MKIVDTDNLVPWEVLPIEDAKTLVEDWNARRARAQTPMLPMTPDQEARFLKSIARDRADKAWLNANTPMGAVFDFLGVAHMVLTVPHMRDDDRGRVEPPVYIVKAARPAGNGGIETKAFTCRELRAILEPGFVIAA